MAWYTTVAIATIGFVGYPASVAAALVWSDTNAPAESLLLRAPFLMLPWLMIAGMIVILMAA